ncbi:sensor histidine kinase [Paenibacillus nasutitermitis]|uniref:histidine kinase n=1 Tax=Paenibacillus nasutitermitis TaxID=1652958 RepID=A0A917DZA5_9BACL|nr:HAMP domain-containing sensor histidine kinase [Paenibacillus nasutitermitis]GGD86876.1 sensor histidine kinase YbdK [Paenibacillus nasutitermitis]
MKPKKSLLNQYLLFNFLTVTILPFSVLIVMTGISPTALEEGGATQYHSSIILIGSILGTFILISWLFFYRIRKRLLRLQGAMARQSDNGIPHPVSIEKRDEIGQLEVSFNNMIQELETSRHREKEEEGLRRQLIANLSHDLRTPITAIRGHAYRLKKEPLSVKGQESLDSIDTKITHLGQLIENLLSYTLLTSGKYPYRPVESDIVRLVRTSFAAWYPVFENMGFCIELELPETTFKWKVDPQWMERMLDNLFQNILRHAKDGKYIGIQVETKLQRIIIEDRGPGMNGESAEKGAGIGLSIADLMRQEMKLHWEFETNAGGTKILIGKRIQENGG